jgi:hypothetical protein
MSLGHPAYLRSKDTGNHNLPEKRRQAKSASRTLRKTRVARSRLNCLKSIPIGTQAAPSLATRPTKRDVTVCRYLWAW